MQNLLAIGSGVYAAQICDFAMSFDVSSFYVRFPGCSVRLQPTNLNGFLRKMRQRTPFRLKNATMGSR